MLTHEQKQEWVKALQEKRFKHLRHDFSDGYGAHCALSVGKQVTGVSISGLVSENLRQKIIFRNDVLFYPRWLLARYIKRKVPSRPPAIPRIP